MLQLKLWRLLWKRYDALKTFRNTQFANVLSHFANVLGQFPNFFASAIA